MEAENGCRAGLLTLPFDLQYYLIAFLDPLDILHLRTTCTAMHYTTSQMIVWIDALRQMCTENAVFRPTFPLEEMTLAELEYAAMAPYKWLAAAAREPESPEVLAGRSRFLSPVPSEAGASESGEVPEEDDFDVRWLFLVPGGRFLITFSWRWIIVWDLGFSPYRSRGAMSKVIARTKVPLHSLYLVHESSDGQGLYILITSPLIENDDTSPEAISVYEVYPTHEDPKLSLIASMVVPGDEDISFYSLAGNRLIFMQGPVMKIWDFKTNEWISWTVAEEYHQSVVAPHFIVLLHPTGVSLWRIPDRLWSSSPPFSVVDPTPVPPMFSIPYRNPRPPGEMQYAGPCDWYSGSHAPLTYDIAISTSPISLQLHRYEIKVNSDLTDAMLVEHPPMTLDMQGDPPIELDAYRFCGDSLVSLWYEPAQEAMRLHTSPARYKDTGNMGVPVQTAVLTPVHAAVSFCPVSGRYVYSEPDEDEDTDSADLADGVVVIDFLALDAPRSGKSNSRSASPPEMPVDFRWMDDLSGWTAGAFNTTQF